MSEWLRSNPTIAWIRLLVVGFLVVLVVYELATSPVDPFLVLLAVGILVVIGSTRWLAWFYRKLGGAP